MKFIYSFLFLRLGGWKIRKFKRLYLDSCHIPTRGKEGKSSDFSDMIQMPSITISKVRPLSLRLTLLSFVLFLFSLTMSNLESVIENEAKKIVGIPRRDLGKS